MQFILTFSQVYREYDIYFLYLMVMLLLARIAAYECVTSYPHTYVYNIYVCLEFMLSAHHFFYRQKQ